MYTIFLASSALMGAALLTSILLRRVVNTNMVHIVQSRGQTTSYGSTSTNGNVYYQWPSWVPVIGVTVTALPVNNFSMELENYMAYDMDRVPFAVDVVAFFRIADTNLAAQRVASIDELHEQLDFIVKGSVRTVLASHRIDEIMLERSKFGEKFTHEVEQQLKNWGIEPVKQLELMDIRDADGSKVIHNIMAKKQSFIEMESRTEVAINKKKAEIAEVENQRETDLQIQQAEQAVGERTAQKVQAVNVANEKAMQNTNDQKKVTMEKQMLVRQVEEVKLAEITKQKEVVKAEQDRDTTVLIAEGKLNETKKTAEGIKVTGEAKAEAEKLLLLAPVDAQIKLAKEIGANTNYQTYLVSLEAIKAQQVVGVEQAKALTDADLKVIANAGDIPGGVTNLMDMFTSKGGTNLSGMLEGVAQSGPGQALLNRLGIKLPEAETKTKKGA